MLKLISLISVFHLRAHFLPHFYHLHDVRGKIRWKEHLTAQSPLPNVKARSAFESPLMKSVHIVKQQVIRTRAKALFIESDTYKEKVSFPINQSFYI